MSSWRLAEDMITAFYIKGIKWPLNEYNDFKTYSESELDLFWRINSLRLLKISNQMVFKTWVDYFWMKYFKEKIWQNNNITESEYKLIIKSLKAKLRKINKVSRNIADKRFPDYSYEFQFIKEYMEKILEKE